MKKLLALLLAAALVMSLGTVAFGAEADVSELPREETLYFAGQ